MMGERSSYSQPLEENKETRIGQVLRRIVLAFSYSPPPKANRETRSEQGFSYSQWLEKNRAKFRICTRCAKRLAAPSTAFCAIVPIRCW